MLLHHLTQIVLEIGLAVILIICSGYAAHAEADMVVKDENERSARSFLSWVNGIGWTVSLIVILGVIGMIMFPEAFLEVKALRVAAASFMYVVLGALLLNAILMFIASKKIQEGTDYNSNKKVFKYVSTGAMIALFSSVSFGLIYGAVHVYDMIEHKGENKNSSLDNALMLGQTFEMF